MTFRTMSASLNERIPKKSTQNKVILNSIYSKIHPLNIMRIVNSLKINRINEN